MPASSRQHPTYKQRRNVGKMPTIKALKHCAVKDSQVLLKAACVVAQSCCTVANSRASLTKLYICFSTGTNFVQWKQKVNRRKLPKPNRTMLVCGETDLWGGNNSCYSGFTEGEEGRRVVHFLLLLGPSSAGQRSAI